MLHHMSFSVRNPEVVANGIARLLGCSALKAPQPPFPAGSWFVCLGDAAGTLLEVLPWGHVQDKIEGVAKVIDAVVCSRTSTHVLLQTPLSISQIKQIAAEEGWESLPADAGFFQFTKVWVEDAFLVELMSAEQAKSYAAHFGAAGITTLDGKLRELECAIQKKLAQAESGH